MWAFGTSVLAAAAGVIVATIPRFRSQDHAGEVGPGERGPGLAGWLVWAGSSLLLAGGLYGAARTVYGQLVAIEGQARLSHILQEPLHSLLLRVHERDPLEEHRDRAAIRLHFAFRSGEGFVSEVPAERLPAPVPFGEDPPFSEYGNEYTVPWQVILSGVADPAAQARAAALARLNDLRGVESVALELELRGGPPAPVPARVEIVLGKPENLYVFGAEPDPEKRTEGDGKVVTTYRDDATLPVRLRDIEKAFNPGPVELGTIWRWALLAGLLFTGIGLAGLFQGVPYSLPPTPLPGGRAAQADGGRAAPEASGLWQRLSRDLGWGEVAWFLAWAVLSSVWCLTAARELSATYDEFTYLSFGEEWWGKRTHEWVTRAGTMPLPVDVATLPVYLWQKLRGQPLELTEQLRVARAGALVFWWVLLFYAWRAARKLGGPWAGRLAVAWAACEPNLLGNGMLAATDAPFTACLLALTYHYWAGRDAGWWRRVFLPGLWLALTLLAKASAVLFAPLCLVAVEVERLARGGLLSPKTFSRPNALLWFRSVVADAVQIVALGVVGTLAYCPETVSGIWLQVERNTGDTDAFILGRHYMVAPWYYFPAALSIKLSTPLLLLPAALLLLRPRALGNWPIFAATALLLYSPLCRVSLGVRYFLPLVAFAIVGLSVALVYGWYQRGARWSRLGLAAAGTLSLLWTVVTAVGVWPHALCYVNELWGGTYNGYRLVSDANYNWGQGVYDIARWVERNPDRRPLMIWFYGVDPEIHKVPATIVGLHSYKDPAEARDAVRGHYLAVATTWVTGASGSSGVGLGAASILHDREPIDRTQMYLIYDFTRD